MSVLHKIKAYLYDNILTTDNSNDFIARVSSERSLSIKEICESASHRGGADVSAAAMEHAVELFLKEMAYQLCDGYAVNTGYFTAAAQIRGVFDSPTESFSDQKQIVLFQFAQGEKLRAELPNISVEILGVADNSAAILQVTDVKTGSVNETLTPNRNLKIAGTKIKVVGDDPKVGIFFVNTATNTVTAVDPSDIVTNNPSELIVVIPNLPAGTYTLRVVTQFTYSSKGMLKEARVAEFDKVLTVK